jgi:hypothetical protein
LALRQLRQYRFSQIQALGDGAALGFFADFAFVLFYLDFELFELFRWQKIFDLQVAITMKFSSLFNVSQRGEQEQAKFEEQVGDHYAYDVEPKSVEQSISDDRVVPEGFVPSEYLDQGKG